MPRGPSTPHHQCQGPVRQRRRDIGLQAIAPGRRGLHCGDFDPPGRGSELLARTTARPACVGASGSSPVGCSVDPAVAGSRAVSGEPAGVRVQRPDMPAPTTPSGCSAPEVVLCRPAGRAYAALMRARSARLNMGQPTHDPWILLRGQAAPMAGLNYSHWRRSPRWRWIRFKDRRPPPRRSSATPAWSSTDHKVAPSEIAIGVIIGRAAEYFDFFVFAIASRGGVPQGVLPLCGTR